MQDAGNVRSLADCASSMQVFCRLRAFCMRLSLSLVLSADPLHTKPQSGNPFLIASLEKQGKAIHFCIKPLP